MFSIFRDRLLFSLIYYITISASVGSSFNHESLGRFGAHSANSFRIEVIPLNRKATKTIFSHFDRTMRVDAEAEGGNSYIDLNIKADKGCRVVNKHAWVYDEKLELFLENLPKVSFKFHSHKSFRLK